jgi:hypothetical protein
MPALQKVITAIIYTEGKKKHNQKRINHTKQVYYKMGTRKEANITKQQNDRK